MRNSHSLPWHRRLHLTLSRRLTSPLDRLSRHIPCPEVGLASPIITRIPCYHPPLAGCRAIQLSDLHLDHYRPRHDMILQIINELKPDWIFVTGDLVSSPRGLPSLFRFLSALRRIASVYLTLGNHDHHSGVPVSHFVELADRHKLHLLLNQVVTVPLPSGELAIVGLDDPVTHRADIRCIPPRMPGRFTVLLAHAPNVLELLDEHHAVDLVLCGHSHGGQWRLPGIRPLWLPYGCKGRAEGHHFHKGHWMYVNRGLGWSLLPIRWNCPPEIVVVEWTATSALTRDHGPWAQSRTNGVSSRLIRVRRARRNKTTLDRPH